MTTASDYATAALESAKADRDSNAALAAWYQRDRDELRAQVTEIADALGEDREDAEGRPLSIPRAVAALRAEVLHLRSGDSELIIAARERRACLKGIEALFCPDNNCQHQRCDTLDEAAATIRARGAKP